MNREANSLDTGISIVCVFNDLGVLRSCLERSIGDYSGKVEIDFIPVDNTGHKFGTAGAALNHGARNARYEAVFFAHQDVYLHSIDRLAAVGRMLFEGDWGLLGANGFTSAGASAGRIRDRALLIGTSLPSPADVDTVDEVLFTVRRDLVLSHPLTENPNLAWHAYAVEYGLRMRRLGKRVGAVDMAATHNSLTINLAKLDVAHSCVGQMYPELRPIQTTCGKIAATPTRWRELGFVRRHGWRARWLRYSVQAERARQRIDVPVILVDICHEVDLLGFTTESPLHLLNVDNRGGFAGYSRGPLRLTRKGRPVIMSAVPAAADLTPVVEALDPLSMVLITDLSLGDLQQIGQWTDRNWVVGLQDGVFWLLGGVAQADLPAEWARPRAVPLRIRRRPRVGRSRAMARPTV